MSWPAVCASGPSCPHPVIRAKISRGLTAAQSSGPMPSRSQVPGPEALQQHVGLGGQLEQRAGLVLHVEVDDALAAVQQVERLRRASAARRACAPAPRPHPGPRASSPRAGRGRCRPTRSLAPRQGGPRPRSGQPPFFTFSTCLRSPSVAVSVPPFMARLRTNPGMGMDRSMVMSNLTRVLSTVNGVSV